MVSSSALPTPGILTLAYMQNRPTFDMKLNPSIFFILIFRNFVTKRERKFVLPDKICKKKVLNLSFWNGSRGLRVPEVFFFETRQDEIGGHFPNWQAAVSIISSVGFILGWIGFWGDGTGFISYSLKTPLINHDSLLSFIIL